MKIFIIWDPQGGIIHGVNETEKGAHEQAAAIEKADKLAVARVKEIELNLESEIASCTCRYRCQMCRRCCDCGRKRD